MNKTKQLKIGIIGFGRFAKVLIKYLQILIPEAKIVVFSRRKHVALPKGVVQKNWPSVVGAKVVIPCVPISEFETVIKKLAKVIKKGSLVVDVCSVKLHPVKIMQKYLAKDVGILATHPMWGPDSARHGLEGLTTVLCPVRVDDWIVKAIEKRLKNKKHRVVVISAQQHDRWLANSQAITHLYGRLNQMLEIKPTPIDTQGFKQLWKIQTYVQNDSWQLFYDMFSFNPFAKKLLQRIKMKLWELERKI